MRVREREIHDRLRERAAMAKFYITTPLYYVNDLPHLGHVFEVIGIDVVARYKRLCGHDVFLLTGTDEHGEKIQKIAQSRGVQPQVLADEMAGKFMKSWAELDISYDDFIRTTQERHTRVVQHLFKKLYESGDIYRGKYTGWYCVPDETFLTDTQVAGGKCPQCQRSVERFSEECYFLRMSKYQRAIEEHLEKHPEFIQPESRRNEMINTFIRPGLTDVCISRSSITWGIPVPVEEGHVIYVWFDALVNYISAIGYSNDDAKFNRYWPADLHVVGKDIVKFHATIWPAILMAAGIPLPRAIYGHGFINVKGEKMSKSLGNVVDPLQITARYGSDSLRYFLLREIPYDVDGVFSIENFVKRYNSDLANDLGNLVHRTLTMVHKYFGGVVPDKGILDQRGEALRTRVMALSSEVTLRVEGMHFSDALGAIWAVINAANKFIEDSVPWTLKKSGREDELAGVIYSLLEVLRIVSVLIYPFMPRTAESIRTSIGVSAPLSSYRLPDAATWGLTPSGSPTRPSSPLFPRIEQA
jgi:methionyl-tRNA synthetase